MPDSSKRYVGMPYEEVKAELLELGFINVEVDEIRDIVKDKDRNLNKVASITVNKNPKFAKGDWIDATAEIKITYHSKV